MAANYKGHLLSVKPFKVSYNNPTSKQLRVSIPLLSGLKEGEAVYEFLLDDGVVMLIPQRLYKKVFGEAPQEP